jgi:hypothetical protein
MPFDEDRRVYDMIFAPYGGDYSTYGQGTGEHNFFENAAPAPAPVEVAAADPALASLPRVTAPSAGALTGGGEGGGALGGAKPENQQYSYDPQFGWINETELGKKGGWNYDENGVFQAGGKSMTSLSSATDDSDKGLLDAINDKVGGAFEGIGESITDVTDAGKSMTSGNPMDPRGYATTGALAGALSPVPLGALIGRGIGAYTGARQMDKDIEGAIDPETGKPHSFSAWSAFLPSWLGGKSLRDQETAMDIGRWGGWDLANADSLYDFDPDAVARGVAASESRDRSAAANAAANAAAAAAGGEGGAGSGQAAGPGSDHSRGDFGGRGTHW